MEVISREKLVQKAGDLKVLPAVARKILDTISDDSLTLNDLCDIIEKDQTIAARILKISNSSFYGLRFEVTSINRAVLVLGLKTIRSLVLAVSTRSIYKRFGITEQKIWEHSIGAAIAAKMIAVNFGSEVEEVAFIGALMHDLGKVVMNNETPDVFKEVMMKTYNEEVEAIVAEQEIYGYNHAEIGGRVAQKWGLSNILVDIMEKHHLDNGGIDSIQDDLAAKSIACVHLADNICKVYGIGYRNPDDMIKLHELPSAVFLKLSGEKLNALSGEIHTAYNEEKSAFQ